MRHIDVLELWARDRVTEGDLTIVKVKAEIKAADVLTKHVEPTWTSTGITADL